MHDTQAGKLQMAVALACSHAGAGMARFADKSCSIRCTCRGRHPTPAVGLLIDASRFTCRAGPTLARAAVPCPTLVLGPIASYSADRCSDKSHAVQAGWSSNLLLGSKDYCRKDLEGMHLIHATGSCLRLLDTWDEAGMP